jgi:hypothetical protein
LKSLVLFLLFLAAWKILFEQRRKYLLVYFPQFFAPLRNRKKTGRSCLLQPAAACHADTAKLELQFTNLKSINLRNNSSLKIQL